MADAVVTVINERKAMPRNAAEKPWKTLKADFDGVGVNSESIEKGGFGVVDFHFPVLLANAITFLVSMDNTNFQPLVGVSIDATLGAAGTTALAGYTFFKIVQGGAEAEEVHVGMLKT